MPDFSTGVFTFLFTDIEGSTRRWALSQDAMRAAGAAHDGILERTIHSAGGRVFKKVGDAVCAVFEAPEQAVQAAIAAQAELASAQWPSEIEPLRVRMGIHSGSAFESGDGDFAGPALNRVARLTAAGHGGQILLSEAAATLLRDTLPDGAALRSLGSHRLRDLTHRETLFQLEAPGLQSQFPNLRTLDTHPNNLPAQISTFVGRLEELGAIGDLLRTHRLITVAGSGGIGKTRLSLQVSVDAAPFFEDGCWFVKLADVRDPQLVLSTLATVLQISEEPGRPLLETVVAYVREKHLLLLLDNSEHLLPSVVEVAGRLLQDCPRVTLLITSREPTHLSGEMVYRLHSLPDTDAQELFRMRALAGGSFDFTGDAEAVAAICRQLDGIPLAIELAAARTQTLSAQELESALRRGSDLLVSKDPQQDARHRTLVATIAWSYDLLLEDEQKMLGRLHVFEGGFTREAALAVCERADGDASSIDAIDSLVDKSFIDPLPGGDVRRFRILEPIRRFLAQLSGRDTREISEAKNRHFAYYLALAGERGIETREAVAERIDKDLPNIRAALNWAVENGDAQFGIADFAKRMSDYWQLRETITEARSWLVRALALPALAPRVRALMLRRAATFATKDDDYTAARSLNSESLKIYRALDDAMGAAEATQGLAVVEHYTGNIDEAFRLYGEALAGFERAQYTHGIAAALTNRSMILAERGALSDAAILLERAARMCRTARESDLLASILAHQGDLELERKNPDGALRVFAEALKIKRRIGSPTDVADILANISYAKLQVNEKPGALEYARSALREALDRGSKASLVMALETFSIAVYAAGHTEKSRTALAASVAMRRSFGYGFESIRSPELLAEIKESRNGESFEALVDLAKAFDTRAVAGRLLDEVADEPV